ncbi:NUDIX domain-containing protein [Luteimicrobium sp. NPDC057192]|uniref:NUDIX hydrolase n=1 Tax=Luteimicrobium sp. NPDC057192 TaxID=3346042 RepID=UPI00363E2E56
MSGSAPAGVIRVAAAVVTDDAGRYLLVRKRGTTAFMQPGGKIEPGEDPRAALVRELAEEISVDVAPEDLVARGTHHAAAANEPGHALVAEVFEVPGVLEPRTAAEIEEHVWVDPAEPGAVELAPLTRDLLAAAARSPR